MTDSIDQDFEPVPGAEDLPSEVPNGEVIEPIEVGPNDDATDPGLTDPPEDD
jgi:hypothetical protein